MKTITIVVPTYNEEQSVIKVHERVKSVFADSLKEYDYRLLFIDNASKDTTGDKIRKLIDEDNRVQAIFNNTNFGFSKSSFYGLSQAEGDCAILMYADMQDPPEVIPKLVEQWEKGYKVVVGVKNKSKENPIMFCIRGLYYRLMDRFSDVEHIKQYDGFGLYDASFVEQMRELKDPLPYLRGLVAELGPERATVEYIQEKRVNGKSTFNFWRYYDVAMLGITSSSKAVLRMATFAGLLLSLICVIIAVVTLIIKILYWDYYSVGTAAIIIGIFFVGGIQIFFLGFLGEYIANINQRTMNHPIVLEKERINMKREV